MAGSLCTPTYSRLNDGRRGASGEAMSDGQTLQKLDGVSVDKLSGVGPKKLEALNPETMAFQGELSVIADQHVPYRLLMEVLYTAGQAELNNYRFIIIQSEGAPTTGPAPAGG